MDKSITKVKKIASKKVMNQKNQCIGWESLLADIENDIRTLRSHRAVVVRKIERGEPWPGSIPAIPRYNVTEKENISATQS